MTDREKPEEMARRERVRAVARRIAQLRELGAPWEVWVPELQKVLKKKREEAKDAR